MLFCNTGFSNLIIEYRWKIRLEVKNDNNIFRSPCPFYIYKEERERSLSEKGHCDAENVTHLLKDKHIDVVISSPYKRAIQTVQGIANTYKLSIQTEEDLRERLLSTEPVSNFNDAMQNVWKDWSFAYEGGESNTVAQKRAVICIQNILKI